jgi:hypothetical protein
MEAELVRGLSNQDSQGEEGGTMETQTLKKTYLTLSSTVTPLSRKGKLKGLRT